MPNSFRWNISHRDNNTQSDQITQTFGFDAYFPLSANPKSREHNHVPQKPAVGLGCTTLKPPWSPSKCIWSRVTRRVDPIRSRAIHRYPPPLSRRPRVWTCTMTNVRVAMLRLEEDLQPTKVWSIPYDRLLKVKVQGDTVLLQCREKSTLFASGGKTETKQVAALPTATRPPPVPSWQPKAVLCPPTARHAAQGKAERAASASLYPRHDKRRSVPSMHKAAVPKPPNASVSAVRQIPSAANRWRFPRNHRPILVSSMPPASVLSGRRTRARSRRARDPLEHRGRLLQPRCQTSGANPRPHLEVFPLASQ